MQHLPSARDIGLLLAELAWQRPAVDAVHPSLPSARGGCLASADESPTSLPLSDLELHVGVRPERDPLSHFAGLLRRIDRVARDTGRLHPTPAEQDTVTGCLRLLLPRLASAGQNDQSVRAAFRPAIEGGPAVRRALDAAWVAALS